MFVVPAGLAGIAVSERLVADMPPLNVTNEASLIPENETPAAAAPGVGNSTEESRKRKRPALRDPYLIWFNNMFQDSRSQAATMPQRGSNIMPAICDHDGRRAFETAKHRGTPSHHLAQG